VRRYSEPVAGKPEDKIPGPSGDLAAVNRSLSEANARLEKANAAMRDFVAVASHDLRSPLTTLYGFSQLLENNWDQLTEDERRSFIAAVNRQAGLMASLVEDLLVTSKIESGTLEPEPEIVDLALLLGDIERANRSEERKLSMSCPIGLQVLADRQHLFRILANLIENAFKYGAPPVSVEAARRDDRVAIRVIDAGNGVEEEFRPRLFERFARADDARRRATGTGLGLSIVRGLALANGGDAFYEPGGEGAVFVVDLPANG